MSTLRVHSDQENRLHPEPFRPKENGQGPLQAKQQQNKRAVLGLLHNNFQRTSKTDGCQDDQGKKGKTYFVPSVIEPFQVFEEKKEETTFKIYSDNLDVDTKKTIDEPLKEIIKENKIAVQTKVEVKVEVEKLVLETQSANIENPSRPVLQEIENVSVKESPMSLDKSLILSESSKKDSRSKREACKASRSNFYDIDEYRADIFNYFKTVEVLHRPKPGYMRKQPDITYAMRTILVDWLVEVAEEYRLHTETLYLAVSYIDRFLSYMSVARAKLQLVGTAAMFIAAKYEEIYPPEVGEFVYITDDTYTKRQVLRMEHLILRVLSFDLTVPTPLAFLMEYCLSNNLSDKIQYLSMYLCELSLLEADPYLQFLPSILAASAVALARHTLREEAWPHELELSTGYNLQNLIECITCLNKSFRNAPNIPQQAIQEKYKSNKYGHVSLLLPRSTEVWACFDD